MKQPIFFLALLLCASGYVYPQANGSFYTLQLGKKTCLFKYQEKADSTYVYADKAHSTTTVTEIDPKTMKETIKPVKDTVVMRKSLVLADTTTKSVNIKYGPRDTVTAIHPVTHKEETKIISYPSFEYHTETTMSYSDFLLLLKSKFELKNPQRNLRVYSFNIYYETGETGGIISIKYPQPVEGVISKLNSMTKNGGFILLSLKAADHDEINIDAGGSYLALIHIKN
jgi:hypothetical protein